MSGYVGRAPGTTTLHLGEPGRRGTPWSPYYLNPEQEYLPEGASVVGSMMAPHDLEMARVFRYTPYMQGWTVGRFTNQPRGIRVERADGEGLSGFAGFGQEAATQADLERQLEMKRIAEELKTLRWNRIWSGVSAVAAVGALLVGIAAFRRGR